MTSIPIGDNIDIDMLGFPSLVRHLQRLTSLRCLIWIKENVDLLISGDSVNWLDTSPLLGETQQVNPDQPKKI